MGVGDKVQNDSQIDKHSGRGGKYNTLSDNSQLLFTDRSERNVLSNSIVSNCGKVEFCSLEHSVVCCFDSIERWRVKDSMICGARRLSEGGGSTARWGTLSQSVGHGQFELESQRVQDCALQGLVGNGGTTTRNLNPETVDAVLKHFDAHNPRDTANPEWRRKIQEMGSLFREVQGIPTVSDKSPAEDQAGSLEEIWPAKFREDKSLNRDFGNTVHAGGGVFSANRTWNAECHDNKELKWSFLQRCKILDNEQVLTCTVSGSTLQRTRYCAHAHLLESTIKNAATVEHSKLTRSYLKDIRGQVKHSEFLDSCLCCFDDLTGLELSGVISCGSGNHGPRGTVISGMTVAVRAGDNSFTLEGSEVSRDEWMDKHGLLVTGENKRRKSFSVSQGNPQACASDALTGMIEPTAASQPVDIERPANILEPKSRLEDFTRLAGMASVESGACVAGPAATIVQSAARDGQQSGITQPYRSPTGMTATGMIPYRLRMPEEGNVSVDQGYRAEPMPEPRYRIDRSAMSDSARAVRDGATASLAVPAVVAELATNHDNDADGPETSTESRSVMCCCPDAIKTFFSPIKEHRISHLTTTQSADRQGVIPSRADVENIQEVEGQTNQLPAEMDAAPRGPMELSGRQLPLEVDGNVYTRASELPAASSHKGKGKGRQEPDGGQ